LFLDQLDKYNLDITAIQEMRWIIVRPKLRWKDGVLQDIRALDIKNWRDMAKRREEWQRHLWKAKVHPGLSRQ
jgi:hypothetical protein